MTPEEFELITNCAVSQERLDSLEAHLKAQDVTLETLQKDYWRSQGARGLIDKFWPILVTAVASIIAGWFLKTFL